MATSVVASSIGVGLVFREAGSDFHCCTPFGRLGIEGNAFAGGFALGVERESVTMCFSAASVLRRSCGSMLCGLQIRVCSWRNCRRQQMMVACCSEDLESKPSMAKDEQPYGIPDRKLPDQLDVVGLGQAMVDFSGTVDDDFLNRLSLIKGTRKVVNHEERGRVLQALDGCSYKVSAGGSLSNTLVALARLGVGHKSEPPVNVAMTGSVGGDPLGDFYRTKLLRAHVHFLSKPIRDGTTGTVIVLTTPDAQRTMLSYQGMSSVFDCDASLRNSISRSRVLVVEGYLWELPETVRTISNACAWAKEHGVLVALTASDVSCVKRHRRQMWNVMVDSADILFTNCEEARELLNCKSNMSAFHAARLLSKLCPLVSVTDGVRGSYIGLKGEVSYVQPSSCVPVDTCGAGDAYAAGILYGLLRGVPDIKGIGNLAARVAAVVVAQRGTRLREEDARELASSVNCVSSLLEVFKYGNKVEQEKSVM